MNRPWVQRTGAVLPWRKILKLLLIQRVVCTALWYKPLSHLYHGIKIGGATPVCFLTGGAFRKSTAVAFRFAYQRFLCQCVILMLYSFLDFWLGQLRWLQKVPFPQTKLPSFSPSTNTTSLKRRFWPTLLLAIFSNKFCWIAKAQCRLSICIGPCFHQNQICFKQLAVIHSHQRRQAHH